MMTAAHLRRQRIAGVTGDASVVGVTIGSHGGRFSGGRGCVAANQAALARSVRGLTEAVGCR